MDKKVVISMLSNYCEITVNEEESTNEYVSFSFENSEYLLLPFDNPYKMPIILTNDLAYPHYIFNNKQFGRVCLFDEKDYISFLLSEEEKIITVIERFLSLHNLSKKEIQKEYLKEFPIYWSKVSTHSDKLFQLFLNNKQDVEWLDVLEYKHETLRFTSKGIKFNDIDKCVCLNNKKALFLRITELSGLLPPTKETPWNSADILDLLCNPQKSRISAGAYKLLSEEAFSKQKLFLILEINNFYVACEIVFKNAGTKKLLLKIESEIEKVIHYNIKRADIDYLFDQIGGRIYTKKVLLIGYGSLGSYVAEELVKSGFNDITIYDGDKYELENVFRHKMPFFSYTYNKSVLAHIYLGLHHPQVFVNCKSEKFTLNESVEEYDIIISTVGSSDLQLMFNESFNRAFKNKPVIYSWLEGDGQSSHALCTFNNSEGCFECCFTDDGGKHVKNKLNISTEEQIHYHTNCCGGTRVEYGSLTLLTGAYITLKAVKRALDSERKKAFVYSFTNGAVQVNNDIKSLGCIKCNDN